MCVTDMCAAVLLAEVAEDARLGMAGGDGSVSLARGHGWPMRWASPDASCPSKRYYRFPGRIEVDFSSRIDMLKDVGHEPRRNHPPPCRRRSARRKRTTSTCPREDPLEQRVPPRERSGMKR